MSEDKTEKEAEAEVSIMSEEEIEKQILEKLPGILKLKEDLWREFVVRDYNQLARLVIFGQQVDQLSMRNFATISQWMKTMDERMKVIEEKLAFLEERAKNDDPKNQKDFYIK
jgi:CRISPR/Cas system-associated protein Cas10 (large subunit of type III CRISPR-Cas system)